MKKYKLIKEYPGSPELGTVAEYKEEFLFYALNDSPTNRMLIEHIENSPEFWEEIIEKDYEILSFALKNAYKLETSIRFKNKWGLFPSDNTLEEALNSKINELPEKHLLEDKDYYIHSVKRLSDGEIFTVGDKIKPLSGKLFKKGIIREIQIVGSNIRVNGNIYYQNNFYTNLRDIKKFKALFKTEDAVDIFEEDKYYVYGTSTGIWNANKIEEKVAKIGIGQSHLGRYQEGDKLYWTTFSTKEAAEKYILLNKPYLSIQDLINIQKSNNCDGKSLISFAKQFVKSKK